MIRGELWRHGDDAALLGARRVEWWGERMRGLLGTREPPAHALYLAPCASVHTIGMRYPLDLVYLDHAGVVLGWRERVAPWRFSACRRAAATVEFHGGALAALQPRLGERWHWRSGGNSAGEGRQP